MNQGPGGCRADGLGVNRTFHRLADVTIGAIAATIAVGCFIAGEARVGGLAYLTGRPSVLRVRAIELIGPDGKQKGTLGVDRTGGGFLALADPKSGSSAVLQVDPHGEAGLMISRRGKGFAWLTSDGESTELILIRPHGGSITLAAKPRGAAVDLDAGGGSGYRAGVTVNGRSLQPASVPTH